MTPIQGIPRLAGIAAAALFAEVVTRAGERLLQDAQAIVGSGPRELVIVKALSRGSLANGPLLLIGTLTAVHTQGARDANADAFRVCLVLIDLRTGKLVAKRVDRATSSTPCTCSACRWRRSSTRRRPPSPTTGRPRPTASTARRCRSPDRATCAC